MIEHALEYLKRGIAVVPAKGKVPLVSWAEFQEEPPPVSLVKSWWKKWPEANIAIVCGKASGNLVVVDIDSKENKDRFKELGLPLSTWIAKTYRGWHVYYRTNETIKPVKTGLFEIKSHGSVVIAPPSRHPSGQVYQWIMGYSPNNCQIAYIDAPDGLLPKIEIPSAMEYKRAYSGVPQGFRNSTLTKLTGSWFRLGMSLEEAISTAILWNKLNTPPLPEKEIIITIKSIWKKELENKRIIKNYINDIAYKVRIPCIPPHVARRISLQDIITFQKVNNLI